ncbi:hypothetical protein ATN81_14975 [Agrobacterium pusense]|uniref:hypothetical protein n=1 Tax=Agrobacterium pusense TaxID=648995 RepID=UPI00092BC378|nr:hypothetical protein [Agrobacterium pusense]OJH54171.1 hypothetical protein ATN81_14975 [Agrobacterium pusense]OJH58585.1 hypothetical protein BA725_16705 [Agrobacterium pusense]
MQTCGDIRALPCKRDHSQLRRFFFWMATSDLGNAQAAFEMYRSPKPIINARAATGLVVQVLGYWLDMNEKLYEVSWRRRCQPVIAQALEQLGAIGGRNYPDFRGNLLKTPPTVTVAPKSLGMLPWPELEGVEPKSREKAALALVSDAALEEFRNCEAIFEFGQLIQKQKAPPEGAVRRDWLAVKGLIESVRRAYSASKSSLKGHQVGLINRASTWFRAGLPAGVVIPAYMEATAVLALINGCLGATSVATASVKALFCCETGWNHEQIDDLPLNPYAYRNEIECGIAERAFLTRYKNRAGHYVHAYLEKSGGTTVALRPEHDKLIWTDEMDFDASPSASILKTDSSLLSILDRYAVMTAPLRYLSELNGHSLDRFFVSLTPNGLGSTSESLTSYFKGKFLGRKGIGYRSIRQSYTTVTRRRTGSLTATKYATDHTRTAVILRHYDDDTIRAELDEAIAFFQNCIQSIILENQERLAFRLEISVEDARWFQHLSIVSGIRAAISIQGQSADVANLSYLEFQPFPENYTTLYLLRRSLIASRFRLGNNRWRAQGLPQLAILNAIRTHISRSGLGAQYAASVRATLNSLRSGKISLPPVLEL